MKKNQTVNYYNPVDGKRREAEVLEIAGTGASYNKVLCLRYHEDEETFIVSDIKHGADTEEGDAFWLLKGKERAPQGWDENVADATVLQTPIPATTDEIEPEGIKTKSTKSKRK